jgi:hypothetical protein
MSAKVSVCQLETADLTYAFQVRSARSTRVPPVSARASQAKAPRAQQAAQVRDRLSLATRTAPLHRSMCAWTCENAVSA